MNITTQKELIDLVEQWENTPPHIYKRNLISICQEDEITRQELIEFLDIKYHTLVSYLNIAHKNRIPFLKALWIAHYVGVDIRELMKEKKH